MPSIDRPSNLSLWLYPRTIGTIKVEQEMTGADTSETYVVLVPTNAFGTPLELEHDGPQRVKSSELAAIVDYNIDWCAALRLKKSEFDKCEKWLAFERKNARELAEYGRLKKKFE